MSLNLGLTEVTNYVDYKCQIGYLEDKNPLLHNYTCFFIEHHCSNF